MLFALALALVMNGVAYWFSDRLALAAASAREVSPLEDLTTEANSRFSQDNRH